MKKEACGASAHSIKGEKLWKIAKMYDVDFFEWKAANP